jgi:hypothetical protein
MNYMEKIAKMFGVELYEEFECDNGHTYMFTKNGLLHSSAKAGQEYQYDQMFMGLLTGRSVIQRKPWKPGEHELFWHVDKYGNAALSEWLGYSTNLIYYKLGNCYRTEEDAKKHREKWMAFYASDEVFEV